MSSDLAGRVSCLLNGCLGAYPFPPRGPRRIGQKMTPDRPLLKGLYVGLAYAVLFCALPWAFAKEPELRLLWLSVYGSLYAAWATIIARLTSAKILEIITSRIVPELSQRRLIESIARSLIGSRNRGCQLFHGPWPFWALLLPASL
jgi:hypothetical protein